MKTSFRMLSTLLKRVPAYLALAALLVGPAQAQTAPTALWDHRFGGADDEYLGAVVATADGGHLLAGYSDSGVGADVTLPGRGLADYWVLKFDAAGTKQWERRYGGADFEWLTAAVQTADGGYLLAGYTVSNGTGDMSQPSRGGLDYWVVRLDAAGTKLWDRRFGGQYDDFLNGALQTADGGFLLLGYTTSDGTGDMSQHPRGAGDGWVVKIDAAGTKQWDQRYGGTQGDALVSAVQTPDGGYLLGGSTTSGANGDVSQPNRGGNDYWIIKVDATGTKLWDRRFGGDSGDHFQSLLQTPDGGFLIGGTSGSSISGDKTQSSHGSGNTGRSDYWLVKTDAAGTKLWDHRYGGANDDYLQSMCPAPGGGYLVAGMSRSGIGDEKTQPSQGRYDYWLVRIGSTGTQLWDQQFGGSQDDEQPYAVALPAGGYLVAGTSSSGASGDKTQPSQGMRDFWAVRTRAEVLATTAPHWDAAVAVYPNPAHAACAVSLPARVMGAQEAALTLLDPLGRVVYTQNAPLGAAPATVRVPLPPMASGLYLLRVHIGTSSVVRRLQVE